MSVSTLTFEQKGKNLLEGIPEFVEITSNVPALIFYTLDGTLPTVFSTEYDGYMIKMPTLSGSVTLSAVGYTTDGGGNLVPGTVLSETYSTDVEVGLRIRNAFFEGISYIEPGGLDIPFWYDSSGDVAVSIDIIESDFTSQLKLSDRNEDGSMRSTGKFSDTAKTDPDDTTTRRDNDYERFDTPTGSRDGEFDPEALFILIDGRENRHINDLSLINGPNMSLRNPEKHYSGLDFVSTDGSNYNSGYLTQALYSREKNIIVFYYFDSNTTRWIKSIQTLPNKTSTANKTVFTRPLVFKWNNFGRHQGVV